MLQINANHRSYERALLSARYSSPENDLIARHEIKYLYHLTHVDNLKSILMHGLLSHNEAHKRYHVNDISNQGVNAYRRREDPIYQCSLHNYVPSYFTPKTPMSCALQNLADQLLILKLSPELLSMRGMLFTDGNAACAKTEFFNQLSMLDQLDWECIRSRYWTDFVDGKRMRSAEVLIRKQIPVSAILQIATKNVSLYQDILHWAPKGAQVTVQPELFF